jgi:glycosyltransferase involved in cell wall biosynthesis
VPDNVVFLGHLDGEELIDFYKNAKIQLMTSRCYEGFPTSLLYGMSAGLPSIVPNHGAMPEIIKDCGLTFNPDTEGDLVRAIRKLYNDSELYKHYSNSAKKRFLQNYTEDIFYQKIMKIYGKLSKG